MKEHIEKFLIVSVAFVIASSLTLGFVFPLQIILLSDSKLEICLVFLPHGVRVLSFYFLGWRAIFYLLPSSYLFLILSNHSGSQLDIFSPIVSMIACYLGYRVATLIPLFTNREFKPSLWKFFVYAGTISSLFNGISLSILQHQGAELAGITGYLIGDTFGLVVCFFILMYAFRLVRLLASTNDPHPPRAS